MTAKNQIVVLGATGRVGSVIVQQLLQKNISVTAVARSPEKLKQLDGKGVTILTGDLKDADFVNTLFANAKAAFVLTPGNNDSPDLHGEQEQFNTNIARAIAASPITHVVSLSSWGAELPDKVSTIYGCYHLEQSLNAVDGLNIVHLRPVWFMDNFSYNIGLIKMAGINGLAIDGDFSFPCIDSKDIGMIAADYLSTLNFKGKSIRYLQGPRDYTMKEVTKILGAAIGKPSLQYIRFPKSVMIRGLKSSGTISDNVARLLVETNERINSSKVHGELRNSNNTTTTTLEDFAKNKFLPAHNLEKEPSFFAKMQGIFLRMYLTLTT